MLVLGLACFATTVLGVYYDVVGYAYVGAASAAADEGRVVTSVDPGSPAAAAGLRIGDVIDERGRFDLRVSLYSGAYSLSQSFELPVLRGGRPFVATIIPERRFGTPTDIILDSAEALFAGIFIAVAGWLACVRPGAMTSALFATSLAYALVGGLVALRMAIVSPPINFLASAAGSILVASGVVGLFVFSTHAPDGKAIGRWRALASPLPVGLAIVVLALTYLASVAVDLGDFNRIAYPAYLLGVAAVLVAAVAAFIERYRMTQREGRLRLRWIALGFASLIASIVAFLVLQNRGSGAASVGALFLNILPYTVLYALLAPRVADAKAGIGRGLVYGTVIALPVILVGLAGWLWRDRISDGRIILGAEVAVAIALVFIAYLQRRRLNGAVDRLFFAPRHRAKKRLGVAAIDIGAMSDRNSIDDRIALDAYESLNLAACAVYRDINDTFVRSRARGNVDTLPPRLAHNTALVVALRNSSAEPFDIVRLRRSMNGGIPSPPQPRLAFPFHVRGALAGFVLVSARTDGEPVSASEIEALAAVALAASSAYGRIAADEAFAAFERARRTPEPLSAMMRLALPFTRR